MFLYFHSVLIIFHFFSLFSLTCFHLFLFNSVSLTRELLQGQKSWRLKHASPSFIHFLTLYRFTFHASLFFYYVPILNSYSLNPVTFWTYSCPKFQPASTKKIQSINQKFISPLQLPNYLRNQVFCAPLFLLFIPFMLQPCPPVLSPTNLAS